MGILILPTHEISYLIILIFQKKIAVNGQEYCINFWDTWGLERLKTLSKIFFKDSQIVIFVYDITSKNSFISLRKWVEDVENIINNEYICGIVGNKQDLYSEEEVNEEDAKEFANSKGMKFKLVSAKEVPKGFNDFLEELLNDGIKYFEQKKNISLRKEEKKKRGYKCKN